MTKVPEQTGFADAATNTLTGSNGFTVMVTVFEVAGLPVGHVALEVKAHAMVFPEDGTKE